jgi:hypothetical protein
MFVGSLNLIEVLLYVRVFCVYLRRDVRCDESTH